MAFCRACGARIDEDSKFCESCGASVNEKMVAPTSNVYGDNGNARRQSFEGEIRKCPNCGDPIDAFELICDKCGFNFSTSRMSTSQERLASQLAHIDSIMQKDMKGSKDEEISEKYKEQKASCINAFPVSNSVEEIVSFMLYASGNIDMDCISSSKEWGDYTKGDHQIAEAWLGKMEQMYQMASLSFRNSPMFQQINQLYINKKNEIHNRKAKSIFHNPFMPAIGILIIILITLAIGSAFGW